MENTPTGTQQHAADTQTITPTPTGFYGPFGGAYVPEILYKCVHDLQDAYLPIIRSEEFQREYASLLRDYVGRPSPLYYARRMSEKYGCKLYLKREDLNHTGAHKINNTIGQILLAKKMGKTRIIAETGAGQHGVATATVCALMDMKCEIFMGATDVERQHTNVERMKMLGATVNPVRTGNMTLSDACSQAIRDWCCHPDDTFYIVGSTMGPHPYPDIVAKMQSVISEELKWQLEEKIGRDYPDYLIACVGGGSNAAGTIYHYVDDPRVKIVLAEAGGYGIKSGHTAATIHCGTEGIIHGARTLVMQPTTDRSRRRSPSRPDSTTRALARCTPTWPNRDASRCWPSTTTKRSTPDMSSPAWRASSQPSRVRMPWRRSPSSSLSRPTWWCSPCRDVATRT